MDDVTALLGANTAYYLAFQTRDFDAMKEIWADEAVSCIHPGWSLLEGRAQVIESYRRILMNPTQSPVTCHDEVVLTTGNVARVLCVEHVGGGALAATNMFVLTDSGWRMVHHQAGPIAAEAPASPQRRVLN